MQKGSPNPNEDKVKKIKAAIFKNKNKK